MSEFSSMFYGVMLFLMISLAPLPSSAATIAGRVFNESGPLTGAKVYAYKSMEELQIDKPFIVSRDTDTEGYYMIDASERGYYFIARGHKDGKEYFAYHGNNPITIGAEGAWMILLATEVKPPVYSEGSGSLDGVVTLRGSPVGNATISLYNPNTKRLRGLGIRTETVDSDGAFSLSQPAGRYMVVAKKTQTGSILRPLKKGDLFCYYPLNPVEVKSDKTASIEVPCYPKSERDVFVKWRPIKPKDLPTVKQITDAPKSGASGIKGKVRDAAGRPIAGVYVLAYRADEPGPTMFPGARSTEYFGQTDEDGRYFIPLNSSGDYLIFARNALGGSPRENEIFGSYGDKTGNLVHFIQGAVLDTIDIITGKDVSGNVRQALKSDGVVENYEYKTDVAIDKDTLWKGAITIHGTVAVKKGATLTIEPGAVIRFKKLDRNHDGIGDGELIVEGRILARGTKQSIIQFTSAEDKPAMKDWSCVTVPAAGTDNIFEYCEFRYAYSGIHVRNSSAKVSDCLFQKNYMGLRSDGANIILEHSSFLDNIIGFNFGRLEGEVIVRNNLVTRNDVGVLWQYSRQKVVDKGADALSSSSDTRLPLIIFNNIYDNHEYNVKLSERMAIVLPIPNNWWGSVTQEGIDEQIFDRKQDYTLGKVTFLPFLSKPVEKAGVRTKRQ